MQIDENYEKQVISIDVSIFSIINSKLHVLLIKRTEEPYAGMWSLFNGKIYHNESCEESVKREIKERLNIEKIVPRLSGVFSDPNRDVRFRNISISYYCLANTSLERNKNIEKVIDAQWVDIESLPHLAFDHNDIFLKSLEKLKDNVYDIDFIKPYLPETFTLGNLQAIYESILQIKLDKRNFRRKLNFLNCLESTGMKNKLDSHKKSEIYKFK